MKQGNLETATTNQLVQAMRLAMSGGRPPLQEAGNIFATACVTAAVLHPEWAAAFALQTSHQVRDLAEAIVLASPIASDGAAFWDGADPARRTAFGRATDGVTSASESTA